MFRKSIALGLAAVLLSTTAVMAQTSTDTTSSSPPPAINAESNATAAPQATGSNTATGLPAAVPSSATSAASPSAAAPQPAVGTATPAASTSVQQAVTAPAQQAAPAPAQQTASAPAYALTDVNVRSGPGTGNGILATLIKDQNVTVSDCSNNYGWCSVTSPKAQGWVDSSYLGSAAAGPYQGLPISVVGGKLGINTVPVKVTSAEKVKRKTPVDVVYYNYPATYYRTPSPIVFAGFGPYWGPGPAFGPLGPAFGPGPGGWGPHGGGPRR
ncbi:SH3 domain-containing protein [Roseibium sp. RKSG952]|uniref:SH3 domain-containing protein n=1 Tax=Roseibium sp. RKSG952 TaxID=2529384 RepID=UPI0012BB80B3|nr:SH3 domain-containing protein [Roseibium sp. RKSG952]MTH97825.1 hypothetical protein [Roseibium sp. RKSG952]